ncbi:hypothetical protein NGA35_11475 [Pseudomonas stutzeri]|nr:hypothetical protein [Stutzerimonas stutzeri]
MRALPLLPLLALLGACASPLPAPDPQQAWIDFRTEPGELLMAERLDGRRLSDGRYFQVGPGARSLEASYRFEVQVGSPFDREPVRMLCYLRLDYPGFAAGQRYRLVARHYLFEPRLWLEDAEGRRLADGRERQCIRQ